MIVIQDYQDAAKVRKDLHVYSTSAQPGVKVREDLNIYRHPGTDCLDSARLSCGECYHPVHPGHPGHPASDVIAIKVLSDLAILFPAAAIDMQVLADLKMETKCLKK